MGRVFSGAVLAFLSPLAAAQNQVNMSPGVTEIGADIFELHMLIMWICVVIGVAVFAVMFYSIYAHRKSKGHQASQFHESTKVEVAWTVVPFLILIAMAVPATSTLLEVYDNDEAELDILITGYQWKWKYEYLVESGEPVAFFSNLATSQEEIYNTDKKGDNYLLEVDEPLVIPTNTKVRFLVTANDVIHSWWVPEIAVKRDAIPGFINEAWTRVPEEGIYRGQCTELCGAYHGFMPVEVHAVSRDEFDAWMAAKRGAAATQTQLAMQSLPVADLMDQVKRSTTAPAWPAMGHRVRVVSVTPLQVVPLCWATSPTIRQWSPKAFRGQPCRPLAVSSTMLKWPRC